MGAMDALSRRDIIRVMAASLILPALPLSIANALPAPKPIALGCSEEFPWFGAHYPDAQCIEGYLWDLDSYEDGLLTMGGEYPCPYCNAGRFMSYLRESVEEAGWIAFTEGESPMNNPYLKGSRFPHLTEQFQRMWREGYREAAVNPEAIVDRKEAMAAA